RTMRARARRARRVKAPGSAIAVIARRGAGVSGIGGSDRGSARFGGHAVGPRRGGVREALPRALRRRLMKECWTDGDLRAYLDRELPGPERDRVAEHLAQCAAC